MTADPQGAAVVDRQPAAAAASGSAPPPAGPAAVAPLLVDTVAAAALCGVSRSHYLALASAGKVPLPIRLGRRTLWRADELRRWIEAGCPARERWQAMRGGRP
ncbi:MAG: helix-turn-helix domain-containing protein [Phycisphaerae bacterium]|nr:helix-turn-helix domain-containing protein [Phycisphaerae bacterium]